MSADGMLRVLFVDDEARVLDGLRRGMRGYRTRWDMSYALGGEEALYQLDNDPSDVVITDMRMPGMDGAALLAEVARTQPQIIRIVLSGQTHSDAARRAVHVAHQFLAKPIAATALAEAIDRLDGARSVLANADLRRRASAAHVLPAAPALYDELIELCADAGTSVGQFAEVIERDPAMAAKVLQLAGSAFFGSRFGGMGMVDVVGYLGLDNLRAIVGAGDLASRDCADPSMTRDVGTCQQHSLLAARIARRIVPDRNLVDDAYIAGLLHDIGMLFAPDGPGDSLEIHAEAGAYLLGIWGLSGDVLPAVAAQRAGDVAGALNPIAVVTRAADALAHECIEPGKWTVPPSPNAIALDPKGDGASMSAWRAIAVEERSRLSIVRS